MAAPRLTPVELVAKKRARGQALLNVSELMEAGKITRAGDVDLGADERKALEYQFGTLWGEQDVDTIFDHAAALFDDADRIESKMGSSSREAASYDTRAHLPGKGEVLEAMPELEGVVKDVEHRGGSWKFILKRLERGPRSRLSPGLSSSGRPPPPAGAPPGSR